MLVSTCRVIFLEPFLQETAAQLSDNGHLRAAASDIEDALLEGQCVNRNINMDAQMSELETEWRHAYEKSISARADYQSLAANPAAGVSLLDRARERLDRAEALKARIMVKIERLESSMLGQD